MSSSVPDIITYRYNGELVYVTPAATYEDGVQFARRVFPELASVHPDRVVISVNGIVNKERQLIRIGPMAWKTVMSSRARYEVLDIIVDPEIHVSDAEPLPEYCDIKEKHALDDFLAPSRAPSPRPTHKIIPVPGAPRKPRSRSSSPGTATASSATESVPTAADWAKSLFGKRVNG
ncbi:hypothetical protein BD414DRAFT_447787 [Trametes punicea]|nr:hypothetical protein BD414DRAFT_447787 [Trametes punicea]